MANVGVTIQLNVKEIWDKLCPECKLKLRDLIKEKVADQMVSTVVGGQ